MKVTHTVLHLETEQEKQMLIKAVAREIVDKAAVASVDDGYEAESNFIPQFEPPIPVAISEAELEDIEPAECTCNHNDDKQEPQSAFSTLRSYLFKHRNSDRVTPVYVSQVECDDDTEEEKARRRAAAEKMFRMFSVLTEPEEDPIHTFTSNKGHRIDLPDSLVQYIKNEH